MKKTLLLIAVHFCALSTVFSQRYWQQQVNFTINVSLNDKDHSLDGFEKIEYINHSPDTLRFIWFHVWPNAYKNDRTAFSDHLLENGSTKFYFSNPEQKGYINRLDFKVDNSTAVVEDHPQHIDIVKLVLPSPLAPGKTAIITTPFHVKMPFNFSRGGHDGETYQATQWFPKPAVYDASGWHEMPYLDQGEFYSEFGNFDVRITVPKNYVVAATGELQDASEKEWLKTRSSYDWQPVVTKEKIKGGGTKTTTQHFPLSDHETKTIRYLQDNIHDFAWFADKRFIVQQDSCRLASGKIIQVSTFYTPAYKAIWQDAVPNAKMAIRHYSSLVGEYPYNTVSGVQGPESFGGGMEYPTITIISPKTTAQRLDFTLAHEIGHNWFYGILASNERQHPWMDEGINSYYAMLYRKAKERGFTIVSEQQLLETSIAAKKDQPIETPAADFSEFNYWQDAYYKASRWMEMLQLQLGTDVFNKAMQDYFREWKFRHPQPADLKRSLEQSTGKNLDSAFALLKQKGTLPIFERKGFSVQGPGGLMRQENTKLKSIATFLPAIGFNSYDKLMLGVTFTNLRLPPNRLRFFLSPMYAIGSKKLSGIGMISHDFYTPGAFDKISIGITGSTFSADRFTDENGKKTFLSFQKIVPSIKLVLKEKSPRSTMHRFIQFRTFLFREEGLRFSRDSVFAPPDTFIVNNYRKIHDNRTLHQFRFVMENNRTLYPYKGELKVEQATHFARAAFTGNYFFNYPKGGGLNVRLFAGKFIYTSPKTTSKRFATSRYHLNMTGANGYEDYTYSDYFVGRNEFEGFASQQIMLRDGAFKVRTDLLSDKVGRTDDWLVATNLTTTIPAAINPLSILPVKIPLKIFVDIGTQANAWKSGSTEDRFLYDAGLQLSFFKETVHFYLPILYSKVFRDYIQSTVEKKGRIWRTASFTIDISNFNFRKINRHYNF